MRGLIACYWNATSKSIKYVLQLQSQQLHKSVTVIDLYSQSIENFKLMWSTELKNSI